MKGTEPSSRKGGVAQQRKTAASRLFAGTNASNARRQTEEEAATAKARAHSRVANLNVGTGSKAAHKRAQVGAAARVAANYGLPSLW